MNYLGNWRTSSTDVFQSKLLVIRPTTTFNSNAIYVDREDMDTGDMTSGLSLSTLDDILDLTYADPTLEGLISSVTTSTDHVTTSSAGMSTALLAQTTEDQVHICHC